MSTYNEPGSPARGLLAGLVLAVSTYSGLAAVAYTILGK